MALNLLDIETEYKKDKNLKRNDVSALMDWVNKQLHLPKINELQAILFLQSCYFSNEAAKVAIDNYFTVKTLCPELFATRNLLTPPTDKYMDVALFSVLRPQNPESNTIIFIRLMDPDPSKFNPPDLIKYLDMVMTSHLYQKGTSNGHLLVVHLAGLSFGHLTTLGPVLIKKFFYYLQESIPLRLQGIHFINVLHIDKLISLIKPFLNRKLTNMLFVHNSVEDLAKVVPKECLPEDYGGSAEKISLLHENMKEMLRENRELFIWEEQQKVDEKKRPGKPRSANELFGVEGTFKKLEID